MPRDRDAATYDRIAGPMFRWGVVVVGWLELEGDEAVLDAGCGPAGSRSSCSSGCRGAESALREPGADPMGTKVYATPQETAERLRAAGFTDVECWLHEEPTPFDTIEPLETYLSTIVRQVEAMATEEALAVAHRVGERMPRLEIDHVRLSIRARRVR